MSDRRLHIVIDEEIYMKLKVYCAEKGRTMNDIVRSKLEPLRDWKPAQHYDNVKAEMDAILAAERAAPPCGLCGRPPADCKH